MGAGPRGPSVGQGRGQALGAGWRACLGGARALAHLPAVLAVAEVVQVAVVRVAGSIRGPRAHLAGVDPILLQELAVGDAEGLADGLCDKLGLLGGQQTPSHPTKPQFQGPHLQETSVSESDSRRGQGSTAYILRMEDMAQHLVETPTAVLGGGPPGHPSPGHHDQHRPDVRNVGDGLQGVVHQGVLWTRDEWAGDLWRFPRVHHSQSLALWVPVSRRPAP